MGQLFAKSPRSLLTECQSQLSQLDQLLLGLASSVDILHTTLEQLQFQLKESYEQPDSTFNQNDRTESSSKEKHFKSMDLTRKLLLSVENGLCHQKTTLLQEISQFVRMIKTKADSAKVSSFLPALGNMEIDHYLSNGSSLKPSNKSTDVNAHEKTPPRQSPGESESIIDSLKEDNSCSKSEIKTLKDKTRQLTEENDKMARETEQLRNKIKKLEAESIQLVPVQLYCQKRSDQSGIVLQELMAQLSGKEHFGSKRLAFIICEQASDIQSKLPAFILCFNTSGLGIDARSAIKGIKASGSSALIILHHKDEHALPNQSSDRVLIGPDFQALGGIFDVGFLVGKGIYLCERNTSAIDGIMTFIQKVLAENPLKVKKV